MNALLRVWSPAVISLMSWVALAVGVWMALTMFTPAYFAEAAVVGASVMLISVVYLLAVLLTGGLRGLPTFGRLAVAAGVMAVATGAGEASDTVLSWMAIALISAWIIHRLALPTYTKTLAWQPADRMDSPDYNPADDFPAVRPTVNFSNVVGMDELKERLKEAGQEIVGTAKNPGAERNGILLFGEPGNGKTMFAEALAGELKLPMITATFGDVASRWVGQTTEQVMAVFRAAHQQQPCLLFLDEIDSLIKDRNQSMSSADEAAKTTNAILTELVKARRSKIVVVAATNFLDRLDQAAIREGRFDFKIEVTAPDEPARAAILTRSLEAGPVYVEPAAITRAAKRWQGFSAARLRAVGDEAQRLAQRQGRKFIDFATLAESLRQSQGRKGKLAEDALPLSALHFPPTLREALEGLAARLNHAEEIEAAGGLVPAGVLFAGPPGTGKTLTARALAKTSGWAFISTSGNELLSHPDKIDEIVREARDIRPAIIFIDEADDVLADRQYARHTASITNRLLTAVDGAGGKVHDIVWIAATNHPDQMDPAALRGGRFTEKILFELPDLGTVAAFVRDFVARSPAAWSRECADVMPSLVGLSLADIQAVLQQSANLAAVRSVQSQQPSQVTAADIEAAKIRVQGA